MKIIGIIIIALSSAFAGVWASQSLASRIGISEQIIKMLREFYRQIRYRAMPLRELLEDTVSDMGCSALSFPRITLERLERAEDFAQAWTYGLENDGALKAEEKRALEALGHSLGGSDIDGQLALLEEYIEKMSLIKDAAEADYLKKGRLYRSLGVLGGAMAAIILI